MWPEVSNASEKNRHELTLAGTDVSNRIKDSGLDKSLFTLQHLNYLEISKTCLELIDDDLGLLTSLNILVLHSNKLTSLPDSLGSLSKLKTLDVSNNALTSLPNGISKLTALASLNAGTNKITCLPDFSQNTVLSTVDFSHNELEDISPLCQKDLVHISDLKLAGNKISLVPVDIAQLTALKSLDLRQNNIREIPSEVAGHHVKEILLEGNNLSDRRLKKLVEGGAKSGGKQILEYIRNRIPGSSVENGSEPPGRKSKGKSKGKKGAVPAANGAPAILHNELQILHSGDIAQVTVTDEAIRVRPHLVCCLIKDVKMDAVMCKKFIQLQTTLHESELCNHRLQATIATHDFSKIAAGNMSYDAQLASKVNLKPLGRGGKDMTGLELFKQLNDEAETHRKEKKRNNRTGLYKYLHLLDGQQLYPCLLDSSQTVISLPPLTNSEVSKLSPETTTIFLEVSSSVSQEACRRVADKLICSSLELGLGGVRERESEPFPHTLTVQQVRVIASNGALRAVYPSREDLHVEDQYINVQRDH